MKNKTHNNDPIPVLTQDDISKFHLRTITWLPVEFNTKDRKYHINRLEDIPNKSTFQVLPHRKSLHDFIFISKGKTIRRKGLNLYEVNAPAIFVLPAYEITEHKMMSDDAEGFYCHFDELIFTILPKKYLSEHFTFFQPEFNPVIPLKESMVFHLVHILERILDIYKNSTTYHPKLVSMHLLTIFEELNLCIPDNTKVLDQSSPSIITKRYKQFLAKHIYEFGSISEYAELLNVTPNYLNKCVKTTTQKTAQDLLKEMMILEAKSLIKHSTLNVSEIAVKLCNQTPSNFTRFFKNQTGLTPKEYEQLIV